MLRGPRCALLRVASYHDGSFPCPAGDVPVYRLWNGRRDSNHRYTTSRATRDLMVSRGYIAEGVGPDVVAMCAPQ